MTISQTRLRGFTIVELLIVVVVIAILAAVTIVAYNGITSRARATKMQAEAQQIKTQLLNHRTLNGSFPSSLSELNDGRGVGDAHAAYTLSGEDFCLTVAIDNPAETYRIPSASSSPEVGACAGHLAVLFPGEASAPTRLGYQNFSSALGGSDTLVASIESVPTGSWMLVLLAYTNASDPTPPAGWTTITTRHGVGTLQVSLYGKIKQSGDANDQSFDGAGTNGSATTNALLLWGGGSAPVASWTLGSYGDRSVNATSTTTVAPAVTVSTAQSLVLALAFERTLADETSYTSVSGHTFWAYVGQPTGDTLKIQTITVGYTVMSSTGTTNPFTVTYPNVQANNGIGVQLVIPPAS